MSDLTRRDFLVTSSLLPTLLAAEAKPQAIADDLAIPEWVHSVTRMAYLTPGEVPKAAAMGVQVVHTNSIWPYHPLRKDGGGLNEKDSQATKALVKSCHDHGMRLSLGLPPFPSVEAMKKHPDWRVHPKDDDAPLKIVPKEDDLGTRLPCNLGPWGDYLIDLCAELVADYGVDGFSFDGNYHPPICYCPACKKAYQDERKTPLPKQVNLDQVEYREYLVWRGDKLEQHYRKLQRKIKAANPDAVLMSWTVNAGRYGHFLHSPRAMPTKVNLLFDLPMQEWWLDETNLGASVVPAFGAAYLRATVGDGRPAAAEPYLMSRGNPYGTDSFPAHERKLRCQLALTNGNVLAMSLGWSGHEVGEDFAGVKKLESYLSRTSRFPWAAMLVSERTRQFYAYKDIADRFLPAPLGAFRMASEEHLPLSLLNDWDITPVSLAKYAVLILPNAAALSDDQAKAIRDYVQAGGGLVASGESSLFDELGRPRPDFALSDLFGVSYRGRPNAPTEMPKLDENFARTLDETYWKQRVGSAMLRWNDHPLFDDPKLKQLVPSKHVRFKGSLARVSEPREGASVLTRMEPEGGKEAPLPAIVSRPFGKGRVVYLAASLDCGLWNYAYPYLRPLLRRCVESVAREPNPVRVKAPLCVQVTHFTQDIQGKKRLVLHFFNGANTAANHGLPATEVPLREESLPVSGVEVRFQKLPFRSFRLEPGNRVIEANGEGEALTLKLPPLETHFVLVVDTE